MSQHFETNSDSVQATTTTSTSPPTGQDDYDHGGAGWRPQRSPESVVVDWDGGTDESSLDRTTDGEEDEGQDGPPPPVPLLRRQDAFDGSCRPVDLRIDFGRIEEGLRAHGVLEGSSPECEGGVGGSAASPGTGGRGGQTVVGVDAVAGPHPSEGAGAVEQSAAAAAAAINIE